MEDKSLTNVAPVADGSKVVYEQPEEQHKCNAGKSINGADQEHHNQAAKDAKSTGVPCETTKRWSKKQKQCLYKNCS